MKICIDAGHGGSDPGARASVPVETNESDLNLSIALRLKERLSDANDVIMTRKVDRTLSLGARTRFANRQEADLYVSIHCNSAGSAEVSGIETFIYPGSKVSGPYAEAIQSGLMARFPGHKDRGVKEANYHVLRETAMPAVLVECEFMSNPEQLAFLNDDKNRTAIADAIADALKGVIPSSES